MTREQGEQATISPAAFAAGQEVEQERGATLCDLAEAAGASASRAITQGWSVATAVSYYRPQAAANGRRREFEAKVAELGLGGKAMPHSSSTSVPSAQRQANRGDLGDQVVALLEEQRGVPSASAPTASTPRAPAAMATVGQRDLGDQVADMLSGKVMA